MQLKCYYLFFLEVLIWGSILSCSSSNNSLQWTAVQQYCQYLNNGEYSKAKDLHTRDLRQRGVGVLLALKPGAIKKILLMQSTETIGQESIVQCKIVYKNDFDPQFSVELKKEDGSWKICSIRLLKQPRPSLWGGW
jgi:hypothetical protein